MNPSLYDSQHIWLHFVDWDHRVISNSKKVFVFKIDFFKNFLLNFSKFLTFKINLNHWLLYMLCAFESSKKCIFTFVDISIHSKVI